MLVWWGCVLAQAARRWKDSSWKWGCRKKIDMKSRLKREKYTKRPFVPAAGSFHNFPLWLLFLVLFCLAQHWNDIEVKTIKNIRWSLTKEYPKQHSFLLLGEQKIMWGKDKTRCLNRTVTCRPAVGEEIDLLTWSQRMVVHCLWAKTSYSRCLDLTFLQNIKHILRVSRDSLITTNNYRPCTA